MNKNILRKSIMIGGAILLAACTDLEVKEKDSVLIEDDGGNFSGVEPNAMLLTGYADLRGYSNQENLYALLEVTSDELLVPTRGTDWGDNGVWRSLYQHTWNDTHPHLLNTWNQLNGNAYRMGQLLAPESNATPSQAAEGRFLRALNMFYVLDLWRQVPFREVYSKANEDPDVLTAQEAFDFIVKDLEDALPNLPTTGPSANTIKASRASANFLLAKLYLNKHIYTNTAVQAADMTKVIQYVDAIEADGFELHEGYFEIFEPTVDSETILWTDASVGNRIWNGLHYFQGVPDNTGGGWNGFATTADFYALFEGDPDSNEPGNDQEERRGYVPATGDDPSGYGIGYGFLVGQQYHSADGDEALEPLKDRAGNPLIFTKDYPALSGNTERNGIRIIKYHPRNGAFASHYILFRYADALLMKAEAILRGGTSADNALDLVNELRSIRGASEMDAVTLDDILDERGRELYAEGWRRNDMVRFGTFDDVYELKDNTEEHRNVFPIPAVALSSNPNLQPTPGY